MRVLHMINDLVSGGAEKLIEEMVPLFNQSEDVINDILLLSDEHDVYSPNLMKKGIKVDVIKFRNLYDIRNVVEIKKYVEKGNYDIVHSHVFPTQYWVALSSFIIKNKKTKFITTEHSTYNRRRDKFYFRPIDKLIYSRYDYIISISEKTKDSLIQWIDPKQKKIYKHITIENGIDVKKVKEALPYAKKELIEGISEDSKIVCMVGRLSDAKDHKTLIKAFSMQSDDVHLVLIGEGPMLEELIDLVKDLKLEKHIHFTGFRQDVHRILKTVDLVVLSSNWEGLSLASIEGLASGKPFVASKVDGLVEIVENYGLLFERGNAKELGNIISEVLSNDDLALEISKRCMMRAENYHISNSVNKTLDIYAKCLN